VDRRPPPPPHYRWSTELRLAFETLSAWSGGIQGGSRHLGARILPGRVGDEGVL